MILFITSFSIQSVFSQENVNDRAKWFVDDRFGMFVHFGLFSAAEGYWKGERNRHGNNYAEWIQYRNRISREEYTALLDNFNWDNIDPEEWVILAKNAGMRYVTFTAKHHDGFALWNSKSSKYNVTNMTKSKRDILKELAVACEKHGLKLGIYYSHWVDWADPNGWEHSKEVTGISSQDFDKYWQSKVIPQMRELLTEYGAIGIMWFDMWIDHKKTVVTKKQLIQLKNLIRELQPETLVNSRLGLSIEDDPDIDFETLDDNRLGQYKREHPWQTSSSISHSFGYYAGNSVWHSTTQLLKSVINNVSLNGNYMLNIGPRVNGEIQYEVKDRLNAVGKWLETNGEAIYGNGAFDLPKNFHDWGQITTRKTENGKHRVYLHVYNWPLRQELTLSGITSKPVKIFALADKEEKLIPYEHHGAVAVLKLPSKQPDNYIPVIVVEYDEKPLVAQDIVAKLSSGGYSLTPFNWNNASGDKRIIQSAKMATEPKHVVVTNNSEYLWKVYIDKPGTYIVDASYSFQINFNAGMMSVTIDGKSLRYAIEPSGVSVAEPNSNWIIDDYQARRIGEIEISSPGFYDIIMNIKPKNKLPIQFQWLWLKQK